MTALILDASAALKLLREEAGSPEVRDRLRAQIPAREPILVPTLFWLEVVNALAMRYRYPPRHIVEAIYELDQIGVTTAEVGRPGVLAAIDAVARYGLTAYDAAYLVLAESEDAQLLTGDSQLASAAGRRGLLVGSGRTVRDHKAAYRAGTPDWTRWKGAAAYLAELRTMP